MQTKSTVEREHSLANVNFLAFSDVFARLVGSNPFAEVLAQREDAFAHEGPVYLPNTNEVTSRPKMLIRKRLKQ